MRIAEEDGASYHIFDEKESIEAYLKLVLERARWSDVEVTSPEDNDFEWTLRIGPIGLSCYFEPCGILPNHYNQQYIVWEETWEPMTRNHPGGPDMEERGKFIGADMNRAVEFTVIQYIRYDLEHTRYAE